MKDNFVFFGTPKPAVIVLNKLKEASLLPSLVVTNPDRPKGRGLELAPSPVKVWAKENNIPVITPEKLDSEFKAQLQKEDPAVCIVVAYGKILKQDVLDVPEKGFLNVHPSLLPLHRGATPVQSSLLSGDTETGVTVMQLDEKMDHGPIVAQEFLALNGTEKSPELHQTLFELGGKLLAEVIPEWIAGNIVPQEQDHDLATYSEKIEKKNGELLETDTDETKWRKYRAYAGWPGVFYFENKKRIKITEASFQDEVNGETREGDLGRGKFVIEKIIPEGRKEQEYKREG
jgi:methionyl-tRNA formyltransferase